MILRRTILATLISALGLASVRANPFLRKSTVQPVYYDEEGRPWYSVKDGSAAKGAPSYFFELNQKNNGIVLCIQGFFDLSQRNKGVACGWRGDNYPDRVETYCVTHDYGVTHAYAVDIQGNRLHGVAPYSFKGTDGHIL